jgi:outer membrane receptor protein involved in Fe transport
MSFHETRLARVAKDGGEWMVGLSLLHNSTRQRQTIEALLRPASTSRIINIVAEQTMFGEVGVSLARNLLLKVGGRLSRARLSGGGADTIGEHLANESHPVARHTTTTALPSFALTWEAGRHTTLFARVQKGHRPGGVALETNVVRSYDSDSLTTWEAGLRYGAEGQAPIHLTLSAVASRWRDIQADFIDAGGRSSTSNIGDGRLYSISSSASWSPYPGLNLDAGVVLNSSKVVPADEALITLFPVGPPSKIPNIANATAHVALGHEAMISDDLRLTISGHARYVGSSRLGVGRSLGARQGSYLDTRLLARVQRGSLGLTVGISNLLDAVGNRFALGTPFQSAQSEQITPLRPRTVRMSLDLDF